MELLFDMNVHLGGRFITLLQTLVQLLYTISVLVRKTFINLPQKWSSAGQ